MASGQGRWKERLQGIGKISHRNHGWEKALCRQRRSIKRCRRGWSQGGR